MGKRVNVLYYHRVYDMKDDINLLCVTPLKFEQQLRYLKKNYDILRFEEDWNNSDGEGIVITFDDGYMDNFEYALPILEELEIPATVFVSAGMLENVRGFWWDELQSLVLNENKQLKTIYISDDRYGCSWDVSTYEKKINCYYAIHHLMKSFIGPEIRNQWFQQLEEQCGIKGQIRNHFRTLDQKSCAALADSKYITIGAHTMTHSSLARMSANDQREEIVNSKDYLEDLLHKEIDMFSYPFGGKHVDYDEDTIQICMQAGIKKAATTITGIWKSENSNYEIPRNVVRNWGISEFQYRIEKYWNSGI